MIHFGSPERDYLLSKGDMTLEKGLRLRTKLELTLLIRASSYLRAES